MSIPDKDMATRTRKARKTAPKADTATPTKRKRASRKESSGGVASEKVASLRVERMLLSEMNPHPRNDEIRKHPKQGSPKWIVLVKSLEHDYFDPIVYNERNGFLVSGHLRMKVMKAEGYTHADTVVVDYDEPTHMARMIAANRAVGKDDSEGLRTFFAELELASMSLDLTGYDFSGLKNLGFTSAEDNAEEEEDHSNEQVNHKTELIIDMSDNSADELEELYDELSDRGLSCRILTL